MMDIFLFVLGGVSGAIIANLSASWNRKRKAKKDIKYCNFDMDGLITLIEEGDIKIFHDCDYFWTLVSQDNKIQLYLYKKKPDNNYLYVLEDKKDVSKVLKVAQSKLEELASFLTTRPVKEGVSEMISARAYAYNRLRLEQLDSGGNHEENLC